MVVLGHEGCGAVKAAQLPKEDIVKEAPKLQGLLNGMKVDLDGSKGGESNDVRSAVSIYYVPTLCFVYVALG